jgi:hypothetical protein
MHTPDKNQNERDEALEAPPRRVSALKHLPQEAVFIPRTADEAVLRAAREHLAGKATWAECGRPRPQQAANGRARWTVAWPSWLRALLRPGTGALRWAPLATATAAAMVLLVATPRLFKRSGPTPEQGPAFAGSDLNRDGQVDILDAFSLARQLKQGGARGAQLDVNGDGVVDERDVSALAARAVRLERGGHS